MALKTPGYAKLGTWGVVGRVERDGSQTPGLNWQKQPLIPRRCLVHFVDMTLGFGKERTMIGNWLEQSVSEGCFVWKMKGAQYHHNDGVLKGSFRTNLTKRLNEDSAKTIKPYPR